MTEKKDEFVIIYDEDVELTDEEIEILANQYEIKTDGGIDNVEH